MPPLLHFGLWSTVTHHETENAVSGLQLQIDAFGVAPAPRDTGSLPREANGHRLEHVPKKPNFSIRHAQVFDKSASLVKALPRAWEYTMARRLSKNRAGIFVRRHLLQISHAPGFSSFLTRDFIQSFLTMAYFAQAVISRKDKAMYRKILLASVGAIALSGSAALAADLPSRAPPPVYLPPPPIFTWTGIYVGGQVGYAWTSGNNNFTGFDPFFNSGTFLSTSIGGTPYVTWAAPTSVTNHSIN
jgi:hypothetical protein